MDCFDKELELCNLWTVHADHPPKEGNRTKLKFDYYCVAFFTFLFYEGEFVARGCLKMQPNWMEEDNEVVRHIALGQLILPGTHNSGAGTSFGGSSQSESIFIQLLYGIRVLDLGVGISSKRELSVSKPP